MRLDKLATAELATMAAPYNPRTISDHDLVALRASLRTFGTVEPIVVNRTSGRIVGGHQRVKAAEAEGISELPVIYVELDDLGERQLNLALNRISGEFDPERLSEVLRELKARGAELALSGFTGDELDRFIYAGEPTDGLVDPDEIPEPPPEPRSRLGDLYELGDHRLVCGDSADPATLDALLAGDSVQLVNTDPPYNVDVQPRSNLAFASGATKGFAKREQRARQMGERGLGVPDRKRKVVKRTLRAADRAIANDVMPADQYAGLLRTWFANIARVLDPGRAFYLWGGYANIESYPSALRESGLYFSQTIVWHKGWPLLTRKDFLSDHEWCFYGWREGAAHFFDPETTTATDVWTVRKVPSTQRHHLTEKPVELAERAMRYSSKPRELVLDLFGGSGSTLIAAERMSRRARIVELVPAYVDVIVDRWETFTGRSAELRRG